MFRIQLIAIFTTLIFFFFILELIRRGILKEKYAILWLGSCLVLLFLSFWRGFLHILARWVGVIYPPSLLFMLAFFFLLLIVLHFSVVISRLAEKNKRLAQEMGLLKMKVEGLEREEQSVDKTRNA